MEIPYRNHNNLIEGKITLPGLTVVCGKNNTGKTSLNYAVSNYLFLFPHCLIKQGGTSYRTAHLAMPYKNSFLTQKHPEIIEKFEKIVGGKFLIEYDENFKSFEFSGALPALKIQFLKHRSTVPVSIEHTSGMLKYFSIFYFVLTYLVEKDSVLILDTPDAHLHPELQRSLAQLCVRLVNAGVKVLITTNSDYFIRELNTLIMLNSEQEYIKKIVVDEGYDKSELLNLEKVNHYETIVLDDGSFSTSQGTVNHLGIEPASIEFVLDEMNRIQESIIWGED